MTYGKIRIIKNREIIIENYNKIGIMSKMSLRLRSYMRLLPNRCALKSWTFTGVYVFLCFTLYWLYGGILGPFLLLCFAATGIILNLNNVNNF